MSGAVSSDIRWSSHLSSALVDYVIGIFLMEDREEKKINIHFCVLFLAIGFLFKERKRKKRKF